MTILQAGIAFLAFKLLYYWHVPFIIHLGIINKFYLKSWSAVFITTVTGYIIGNICTDMKWQHTHLVFRIFENPTEQQVMSNIADGANLAFWLLFGWIASFIYALFWLWLIRYLRK